MTDPAVKVERAIADLRGPVHGRIQTIRGMCTDERSHIQIDLKLSQLDDLVDELITYLRHGQAS